MSVLSTSKAVFSCRGKTNAFSSSTGDHITEQFWHVQKPLKNQCSVVRNRCSMLRLLPSVNCIMLRFDFCPLLFWGGLGNGRRASYVSAGVWQLSDRNVFRLDWRKTVGICRVAGFEVNVSICLSFKKTQVRRNAPLSSVVKLKGPLQFDYIDYLQARMIHFCSDVWLYSSLNWILNLFIFATARKIIFHDVSY